MTGLLDWKAIVNMHEICNYLMICLLLRWNVVLCQDSITQVPEINL